MAQGVPKGGRLQEEGTPREPFIDVSVFQRVGRGKGWRGEETVGRGRVGGREGGKEAGRETEGGRNQTSPAKQVCSSDPAQAVRFLWLGQTDPGRS